MGAAIPSTPALPSWAPYHGWKTTSYVRLGLPSSGRRPAGARRVQGGPAGGREGPRRGRERDDESGTGTAQDAPEPSRTEEQGQRGLGGFWTPTGRARDRHRDRGEQPPSRWPRRPPDVKICYSNGAGRQARKSGFASLEKALRPQGRRSLHPVHRALRRRPGLPVQRLRQADIDPAGRPQPASASGCVCTGSSPDVGGLSGPLSRSRALRGGSPRRGRTGSEPRRR